MWRAIILGRAFRFQTPSSVLVVGPSGCGKTVFTEKLLLDNLEFFDNAPTTIHYCYGTWQDRFQTMKDRLVQFHEGIPNHQELVQWFPNGGGILVLDDLMDEGSNDKRVLDLFTKHSHQQNMTVLYLCQDMFPVGKYAKSISRNVHYIVTFKNPRDQLGVRNVLLQSFPTTWKDSLDIFHRTTRSMADDDESRHPSKPHTPVNPAGVGSSTSNRASPGMVSPDTIREILQTGDQNLVDDAFEQFTAADMGRLLEAIPTPPPITVSPVGVGSVASNLSQSPGLPRTPTGGVAGAGGGSSPGSSGRISKRLLGRIPRKRSRKRQYPTRPRKSQYASRLRKSHHPARSTNKLKNSHKDELKNGPVVPTRLPHCRGPDPVPLLKRPPKHLPTNPICNADCVCCYKIKNKLRRDDGSLTSPLPIASSPAIKREDGPACKAIRRGVPFEKKKCLPKTP